MEFIEDIDKYDEESKEILLQSIQSEHKDIADNLDEMRMLFGEESSII